MPAALTRPTQRIYIVRRKSDGLFLHCTKSKWTNEVASAFLVSHPKYKGLIRADLGHDLEDFDMVEVVPVLAEPDF